MLHVTGLCSFYYSFWYLHSYPTAINSSYGSNFQHLTNLGLLASSIAFIFGLLADITLSPKLFMIKNVIAFCCAPLELLISLLFWSIFYYDKSLLMTPEVLKRLNPYANVSFHLNRTYLLSNYVGVEYTIPKTCYKIWRVISSTLFNYISHDSPAEFHWIF